MARVAARYTGPTRILSKINGRVYGGDGKLIQPGKPLETGMIIMFADQEVYGMTLKYDPRGNLRPLSLGVGKAILPEHAEFAHDEDTLTALGYEFHAPREDVEPIEPIEAYLARLAAEKAAAEEVAAKAQAEVDAKKQTAKSAVKEA